MTLRHGARSGALRLAVAGLTVLGGLVLGGRGQAASASPCGQASADPTRYDHVVWVLEENHSLDNSKPGAPPDGNGIIGNSHAPYINSLASRCGYSTGYQDYLPALPSEPHYLAEISGSNCNTGFNATGNGCIVDDNGPASHMLSTSSLFQQVKTAGKTWRSYQEGASKNCVGSPAKHDAAVFYTRIHTDCLNDDIPIPNLSGTPTGALANDIKNNALPAFAYITPNQNHDMHVSSGGTVGAGDTWLKAYLPLIINSATYRLGRTAIFVSWDEGYPGSGTQLPSLIIAPTVPAGAVSATMNGAAMLRTTEDMLGLPHLGHLGCATGTAPGGVGQCPAGSTASLRTVFDLLG